MPACQEAAHHVAVAVVNEGLAVVRHFTGDVAQMHIRQPPLPAVVVDRLVNVTRGHFRQRADAKLQRIGRAGLKVEQALVVLRLVDQPRLAAHGRRRRIVRVRTDPAPFEAWYEKYRSEVIISKAAFVLP